MEDFYCGDIVEPGTHINLADVVHYFNIVNGDIDDSDLTETQKRLLNILNSDNFDGEDFQNLDDLYSVLVGVRTATICSDKPVACCEQKNRIQTYGDMDDYPAYRGLSVQAFEAGGYVCFDDLNIDGLSNPFGVTIHKKDGTKVFGKLKATGKFKNNEIVYYSPTGEYYTGKLISQVAFENELEYAGECAIDGVDPVVDETPTPTVETKAKCEDHSCNLRLIRGEGDVEFNNAVTFHGDESVPTLTDDGSEQIETSEDGELIISTKLNDSVTNWLAVLFSGSYILDTSSDSFCVTLKFSATATDNVNVGFVVKQNNSYYVYHLGVQSDFTNYDLSQLELSPSSFSKLYGGPATLDLAKNAEFEFGLLFANSKRASQTTLSDLEM